MIVIEKLKYTEDVYDLTVERNHNFYANDILVHNCAEQGLASNETCCLAEIFLPNISSKEELIDICTLLYRVNKHSLALPCHQHTTEKIVHENMRMGIGITGLMESTEEQKSWLSDTYVALREYDNQYSNSHGFPRSVKLTTCKPSGCTSLDTSIKIGSSFKTMREIFAENGYSQETLMALADRTWLEVKTSLHVMDESNQAQPITKLFLNGPEEVYAIEFEDGTIFNFTGNHKLKTTTGWKQVMDLTIQDEIISY
jgi:hypothetical protein